jgi:hypothetical protein
VTETSEVGPLDWKDLALLHRVRDRGLCLDSQLAFTKGANALQHALFDVFSPGQSTVTLVAHSDRMPAIGQCMQRSNEHNARLTFLGPVEALEDASGGVLLDALSQAAGERRAHNLIAEVDEDSFAFERLQQAGFAVYARQRIWQMRDKPPNDLEQLETAWRVETDSDQIAIGSLHANLVPGFVQQVESPPTQTGRNLVHWREGELLGYLEVERGPLGAWVQPYFHPAGEQVDRLLSVFLAEAKRTPLYICVRSYQSWMGAPLERLGFEPLTDQAVMVKRLTAGIRKPATSPLPALEGTSPEPTAPFARLEKIIRES